MRPLSIAIVIALVSAPALAGIGTPRLPQSNPKTAPLGPNDFAWPAPFDDCVERPGNRASCAPIVACVGENLWFSGRATGWNSGTLVGFLSDGSTCSGNWMSKNFFGLGQADVTCSNGLSARVFFTYQDGVTGTTTGTGLTTDMRRIRAWSGHNIRQFLRNDTGQIEPHLMCGNAEIPIS